MASAPSYLRNPRSDVKPAYTLQEERDASFIDSLIQMSEDRRTETFGPNYFDWAKEFFMFKPAFWQPQLEYQIRLRMPDLQMLMMQEASDLTDSEPKFFISRQGQRKKEREEAFHANWRAQRFQMEWFKAELWSLLCHTGFVEVMVDPHPPRHAVSIRSRHPQSVYPDPFAPDWREWEFVIVRVPMAPDEIARAFPQAADRLPGILAEQQRDLYLESRLGGVIGAGPMAIEMPPGAMQSVAIGRPPGATDFLSVDYVFIKDETRQEVAREIEGSKAAGIVLPPPSTIPKYPTGRLIVRCGKLKLWDGPNQYRRFPIIPVYALPPLFGTWGTPPVQYLIQIQHLAESMYSQHAENMIRLNYGYRVYQDGAVLNPENLDKLGGSIRVKSVDDVAKALRVIQPTQFSSQQTSFPTELFTRMRTLFGYTPEREGSIGKGNVSPGLLDAGVSNAMGLTRMRARLLAESVEEVGKLVFETMVDWLDETSFAEGVNGEFKSAPWQGVPLADLKGWKVQLDAASIKPMSDATMRQLVPVLANLGALTPPDVLEMLDVPDAKARGERIMQQQQMQAMLAAATGKKGKGK